MDKLIVLLLALALLVLAACALLFITKQSDGREPWVKEKPPDDAGGFLRALAQV